MCGVGTLIYDSGTVVDLKLAGCGKWDCETGAEALLRRLRHIARLGQPTKFLTLTVNPAWGASPEWRRKKMAEAWAIVVKRWQRLTHQKLEYLAWCEEQPGTGEPHLHIFVRGRFLHWSQLLAWWRELAGGSRPQIKAIYNPKQMFRYVKGYLKGGKGGITKYGNCKRYWKSKNYVLPEVDERPRKPRPIFTLMDLWSVKRTLRAYSYYAPKGEFAKNHHQAYWLIGDIRGPPDLQFVFGRP